MPGQETAYDPQVSNDAAYQSFAVTVDVAAFARVGDELRIALIERGNDPFKGKLALPGGFVEIDEDLPEAAVRELAEETGLAVPPGRLRQVAAYGQPGRDPRMRVVTIVFWVVVESLEGLAGGSDAADVAVLPVDHVMDHPELLAFDHPRIIGDAVSALVRSDA